MISTDKGRTCGDGIDHEELGLDKTKKVDTEFTNKSSTRSNSRRKDSGNSVVTVHHLNTLNRITSTTTDFSKNQKQEKNKPPLRLLNYEPSTCTTNVKLDKRNQSPGVAKINKNNLDIGVLATQMSNMRNEELEDKKCAESNNISEDLPEMQELRDDLAKIKEERDYYQSQLKFQTQVNSELKHLLVASVGEDLQTRVNVLTEDKLYLARALMNSANNLTTHTEQMEYLAGQCEVWRSKFLASSVMIEELARWKADLSQKNEVLAESMKNLLQTTKQLRQFQLDILRNLKFVAKIRYLNLPATDVISLCAENVNIVQQMVLHSGLGMPDDQQPDISTSNSNSLCDAEICAEKALNFISQPLMATDDAIRALFGQIQRPCPKPTSIGDDQRISNS